MSFIKMADPTENLAAWLVEAIRIGSLQELTEFLNADGLEERGFLLCLGGRKILKNRQILLQERPKKGESVYIYIY